MTTGDVPNRLMKAIEDLAERTQKIGLYYQGASIGADDPDLAAKMQAGELTPDDIMISGGQVIVISGFNIGDMAFSRQVAEPEQHELDKQAQAILPTEVDLLKERLMRAIEEGRDPLDLDD